MKKNIIIAVLSIILIGFLIYNKDNFVTFFYETFKEKTSNNDTTLNDTKLDTNQIDIATPEVDPYLNLTEEEKIQNDLKYLCEYQDIFQGENFDESRYSFCNNFIDETNFYDGKYYLTNYINNLRNKPDKIIESFEKYKYFFYNLISERTYKTSNIDKIISGLLLSYNDIYSDENHNTKLKDIYDIMKFQKGYDVDAKELYPKIEPFISNETLNSIEEIRLSSGKQFADGDIVWFYSFWARRKKEGNINEVYTIINDMNSYYTDDF